MTENKTSHGFDEVFDRLTAWTAEGLSAAKRGLEASARWLDARAKDAGHLATKIAPREPANPDKPETAQ